MNKFKSSLLFACICPSFLWAGLNISHPDYWKNRRPSSAYWQQDVHYTIDAHIDDSLDEIKGTERLVYYNNSPDHLDKVYFHLYQNAFQPGAYAHALNEVNHEVTTFGKYEAQKMGTLIDGFKINGQPVVYTIDNTILMAKLQKSLAPGDSLVFDIQFRTYWDNGSMRRRFKVFSPDGDNKHFDGVHWYPRICVYDRKFGWETDQHLGKEFYGDYGVFDVVLDFPSKYVVEATGVLSNANEVMPESLRKQLDIANYSKEVFVDDGKAERVPSGYKFKTPTEGRKQWRYHAENVHDFAFTADPTYRMASVEWKGIQCIALAQEQNAPYWYPTAAFVAKVVETYSTDFGMYGYPKIVAADARDGMEYPMITLNGGNWPGHQYVIAHEVGHNWFFGMIGNNETYRAMLDEGFTQFLTSWSIKRFNHYPLHASAYDEQSVYNGYLNDALNHKDIPLNTHSDDFSSAVGHGGGYRHVYYKTATMLYNLQYVLGDTLFLSAMKHYFNTWKFAHPYPEDFRAAIIHYSKVDLNWFFDQWMETTKTIDYKVMKYKLIKTSKSDKQYQYAIQFKRKGDMQMPLDVTVTDKANQTYEFIVPNTYFVKPENRVALKTWKGWGLLNQTYTDTIQLKHPIKAIVIDATHRLADVYRMDNVRVKNAYKLPMVFKLNKGIAPTSSFNYRNGSWSPDLWFNAVDGLKIGVNTHFEYVKAKHVFDWSIWYNSGIGAEQNYNSSVRKPLSYALSYSNLVGKDAFIYWNTKFLDGVYYDDLGFKKTFGQNTFNIHFKSIVLDSHASVYWPSANSIEREAKANTSIIVDYIRQYKYLHGNGTIKSSLRGSSLSKDYGYGSFKLEVINNNHFGKLDLKTRFYFQHIAGNAIPEEVLLNLASANMEDLLESKFTRSRAWIPPSYLGYGVNTNHFQMGGGLNLRGYAGYLAPVNANGNQYNLFQGNGGVSGSVELDFDRLVKWQPKLTKQYLHIDAYAFADAGLIYQTTYQTVVQSPIRMDAGLGMAASIYKWGKRNLIQPFTIRLDAPVFLNTPPFVASGYLQNRWVIGIGRSF
ncbi:MAG: hypothetical protein RLZZ60_1174 [Bacteroidota bacterium]